MAEVLSCEASGIICFVYRKCAMLATQPVSVVLIGNHNGHISY